MADVAAHPELRRAFETLAQLGRDNEARPVRRAAGWYKKLGVSQEVARVREALEPGKSS